MSVVDQWHRIRPLHECHGAFEISQTERRVHWHGYSTEHRKGPEQSTEKDQSRAQERIRAEHRKGSKQSTGKDQSRAQKRSEQSTEKDQSRAQKRIRAEHRKGPEQSTGKDQSSFFFLHCRASTGHGRSTLEICESKKCETGITCRSLFTGWEAEQPKAKQTTKTKHQQTHKKEPVKILAKVVKPARPP